METLLNDSHNYINEKESQFDTALRVVAECVVHDFGADTASKLLKSISMSDVIVMRNAYRNMCRTDPHIAHIFMTFGMSLV